MISLKDTQGDPEVPEEPRKSVPEQKPRPESRFFIKTMWDKVPLEAEDAVHYFKNVSTTFHRDIHQTYKEICKKENWGTANMRKVQDLLESPLAFTPGSGDGLYAKPMSTQLKQVEALSLDNWVFASGLIGLDQVPVEVDHAPQLDQRLGSMIFATMELGISLKTKSCADWERDLFHQIALSLNHMPTARIREHEELWRAKKASVVDTIIHFQAAFQSDNRKKLGVEALRILENQSAILEIRRRGGTLQNAFFEWQESVYRRTDRRVLERLASAKGIPVRQLRFVQVLDPFKFWPMRLGRRVLYQWHPSSETASAPIPDEIWQDIPPSESLEVYAPIFYEESGGSEHYVETDPKTFAILMNQQFSTRLPLETIQVTKQVMGGNHE
ncbi:MAG: hypothetical protein JJU29_22010 [Verrucomicrobia bacterium]|nr:hypothetical protein [Verrucomicrobiota bacterium]